mgnify:CR=1 FL=1
MLVKLITQQISQLIKTLMKMTYNVEDANKNKKAKM